MHEAIKKAKTRRGFFKCAICQNECPTYLPPKEGSTKRINNAQADHITPIIPLTGFKSWDETIEKVDDMHTAIKVLAESSKHLSNLSELKGIGTDLSTMKNDIGDVKGKLLDAALGTGPFPKAVGIFILILSIAVGVLLLGEKYHLINLLQ